MTAVILNVNKELRRPGGHPGHRPRRLSALRVPVEGMPPVERAPTSGALTRRRRSSADGDVLVVAQKAVSKAEGRIVALEEVERRRYPPTGRPPTTRDGSR